jgi:hypothetical protein
MARWTVEDRQADTIDVTLLIAVEGWNISGNLEVNGPSFMCSPAQAARCLFGQAAEFFTTVPPSQFGKEISEV